MESFQYESSSTHGVATPNGKKLKSTNIKVVNGRGVLRMTVEDTDGAHSDTRDLTEEEVRNIKKHKFMPNLFSSALTNINSSKASLKKRHTSKTSAKKRTKKRHTSNQGTRKHK